MAMNRYKIAVFHDQGFEEFSKPEYLGREHLVALAFDANGEEKTHLCRTHIEANARSPEARTRAVHRLVQEIEKKLGTKEWYTLLSTQDAFRDLRVQGQKCFVVPEKSAPGALKKAQNLAQEVFHKEDALFYLEFPELKGVQDGRELLPLLKKRLALAHLNLEHHELAPIWAEAQRKDKMLVHICCGPDAAGVIEQLKDDYELLCFWYDPNIQPKDEHDKRLDAFVKVAEKEKIPYVIGEYDVDRFLKSIKGLEATPEQGAKCSVCYDLRMERAAVEAKKQGCQSYTTSLAISPHKVQKKLKAYGELFEKKHGIPYYAKNFMKSEGFKSSVEYSRDYDIYRQDYCGCWFSLHEGGEKAQQQAAQWGFTRKDLDEGSWSLP